MQIAIADSCNLKFCKDLKEHWEKKGHEVKFEWGGSEILAVWADLYYIDWFDNNIAYLFNWYKENPKSKKPKFAVRVIDWDFWTRGVKDQEIVDFVDYWITLAPHIYKLLQQERDEKTDEIIRWNGKLKFIKPGVNIDKFPLKTSQTDGFQLGMVLGDMWWMKNHMGALDIFTELYRQDNRWRLHIRGQHELGQYYPVMFEHYLESREIKDKVFLYENFLDINDFYEKIDILLHPSLKEGFCYAVAEAFSKGIPCVINNFYGTKEIWDSRWIYDTHQQAVNMIDKANKVLLAETKVEVSLLAREIVKGNYPLDEYLKETDEYLGT